MKAIIFDIQRGSYVDGPGIRTTVFFKGCNLKCKWCHNPESQSCKKQMLFYKDKCSDCGKCTMVCQYSLKNCDFCGKCALFCPNEAREICGKEYTIEEVFAEIIKDKDFYLSSGGGVTFSGGECMLQIDFLEQILKKCKENNIHTAVDTAGNVPWEYFERILPYTNLFLYDIKAYSAQLHKEGTGVSNALILDNLDKLCKLFNGDVIIRIPIIPNYNTNIEELNLIANFLLKIKVKAVELLPYHSMGEHKWAAAGLQLTSYPTVTPEELQDYKSIFKILNII